MRSVQRADQPPNTEKKVKIKVENPAEAGPGRQNQHADQSQKQNKARRGRGSKLLPAFLIVALLLGGFFGWMNLQARVTHLRRAEVYLPDLPAAFDGTTLLYVSDLNIRSSADARACTRLLQKLAQAQPDILVLGGDYTAPSLLDLVNSSPGDAQPEAARFIRSLADFPAPLGRFAVTGEHDRENKLLDAAFADAGVRYLDDDCAVLERDGDKLYLAGLSDVSLNKTQYKQICRHFSGDECVVTVVHNPAAYVGVRVNEAKGGGAWADLVLAGHTLGGQIKLFDRTIRTLPAEEARCLAGWYYLDDLPMLVSQGVGCEGSMLRLDTRSEVWLLTLRRPQQAPDDQAQPASIDIQLPDF